MIKTTTFVLLATAFALGTPPGVSAQSSPDKGLFVDINAGVEALPKRVIESSTTFPLYGETAFVDWSLQPTGGALLHARFGYRVNRRLGFAVAGTGTRSTTDAAANVSIPSPIRFASPTTTSLTSSGYQRREVAYHVQAVFFLPVNDMMTVSIFGGPSFVHLQQNLPSVTVGAAPSLAAANEAASSVGVHAGVDASFWLSAHVGAGVFAQFLRGTVDLPSVPEVKVGGTQAGGGIRLRF